MFHPTPTGVPGPLTPLLGLVALGKVIVLGCTLHPCKPWGVMGCLLPFLASSTRREGRHWEAGVLSRRLVV